MAQLDASVATVLISEDEASFGATHDGINDRTNIAGKSLSIVVVPLICGANWPEDVSTS